MKKFLTFFAVAAALAAVQQASAQDSTVITQIVTSGGSTGEVNIEGDATLTSVVANGITYDEFIGIGVSDPTAPVRLFATMISDPGSEAAAVSDANVATGTLNTGSDAVFDLTGQTLDATTTLYIIGNGNGGVEVDPDTGDAINSGGTTPPNTLSFVDAAGTIIGSIPTDYFFQDPGINAVRAPNLITVDFARSSGDAPLVGRTVSGAIVPLADITFTTGGIADVAGFMIASNTSDIQDVGIAFPAEVTDVLLGDADCNGVVNFDDIGPFIALLSSEDFKPEGDTNEDGEINFSDISSFIAILAAAS